MGLIGRREAAPFSILNKTEIQHLQKARLPETRFREIKKKDFQKRVFAEIEKRKLSETHFRRSWKETIRNAARRARGESFFLLKVVLKTATTTEDPKSPIPDNQWPDMARGFGALNYIFLFQQGSP